MQLAAHLNRGPEVPSLIPVRLHTFVSPVDSRRAVVSFWQKYVHLVLINHLGALSLPRNSVVTLTDHPDMTIAVYHGLKETKQQTGTYVIYYCHPIHRKTLMPAYM